MQKQDALKTKANFVSLLKQKVLIRHKAHQVKENNQNKLMAKMLNKWLERHDQSLEMKEQH